MYSTSAPAAGPALLLAIALALPAANAAEPAAEPATAAATEPAAESAAAPAVVLRRTDNGAAVDPAMLAPALVASSVDARLGAGASLAAWGVSLRAGQPARVLLSASSELVTAAVTDGAVEADGVGPVGAGEAVLLIIATGEQRRVSYDAARLAASLPASVRQELQPALERVAAGQARRRWWGWYEPLGLNARAPVAPDLEALRRQYLLDPTVVEVRREARGSLPRQRSLAAERFVAALSGGDAAAVAGLLDPTPFLQGGRGWTATRAGYANRLALSPLAGELAGATVAADAAPGRFTVTSGAGTWLLTTADRDNMTFVTGIEARAPAVASTSATTSGETP